jgi:hypothetical protein
MNGGVCTDQTNGYVCECPKDFTGENCETEVVISVSTLVTVTEVTTDSENHKHFHRYFYSTCWGENLWLRFLLKQKGFDSWISRLFDKKDNKVWLANLKETHEIDADQEMKLADLLENHAAEFEADDQTARWWKNLPEQKWNGCVPFWSKMACKRDLELKKEQDSYNVVDLETSESTHSSETSYHYEESHSYTKKETETSKVVEENIDVSAAVMTTTGAPEVFGLPAEEPASSEEESSSSSKKYLRGKHNKESDSSDSESESDEKEEPSSMMKLWNGLTGGSPQEEELPQLGGGGMPSFTI